MKKLIKTLGLVATVAILTSCGPNPSISEESSNSSHDSSTTIAPEVGEGYHRVDKLSFYAQDVKPTYSASQGVLNVLIIPLDLPTGGFNDFERWSNQRHQQLEKEFFGKQNESTGGWNSLKSYYETASFGKTEIQGFVADIYHEKDNKYSLYSIQNDPTQIDLLHAEYKRATEWVLDHHSDTDWTQFDLNNDGCFDAIHFITNAGQLNNQWNSPLWPHMAYTGFQGTHERPMANVYSNSCLGQMHDGPRTQIHEQGHMLGLEDYYDYSYPNVADYIGGADMQDMNMFDWNSYSKMAVGWANPYVIDGTSDVATVTMSAASLNGDCLIIPADYSTWNGSAYDEYFLIELFSPFNNNEVDWNRYNTYSGSNLGEYGVRMYHVDSRLWACESSRKVNQGHELKNLEDIQLAIKDDLSIDIGPNNSYDGTTYAAPCPTSWLDYKLLSIIQRGKVDTFGSDPKSLLSKGDLFRKGDVFKYEEYSHFLSKFGKTRPTTDKGEVFPYEITFKDMSKREVTIEVKKVK